MKNYMRIESAYCDLFIGIVENMYGTEFFPSKRGNEVARGMVGEVPVIIRADTDGRMCTVICGGLADELRELYKTSVGTLNQMREEKTKAESQGVDDNGEV